MSFRVRLRLKVAAPIRLLLTLSSAYCSATGLSEARVSTLIFDHGARLKRLREGSDIRTRSVARAVEWFDQHWPSDLAWPSCVERPVRSEAGV